MCSLGSNSNMSRKTRETNQSRGNKTHLIFLDQAHNSKITDAKIKTTNFNLSGPVNLRHDSGSIPFDSTTLSATNKASVAKEANKSQKFVPDTNSTLAYTAACASSNKGNVSKNPAKR